MDSNLVGLVITGVLSFIAAVYATNRQHRQERAAIKIERSRYAAQSRLEQDKFQSDLEAVLWKRVQGELNRLAAELKKEREKRYSLERRFKELANENARLNAENLKLKERILDLERRMGTGPLSSR